MVVSHMGQGWHPTEIKDINYLELETIEIDIHIYFSNNNFKHVRVMCDNTTAMRYIKGFLNLIGYINHIKGIKSSLCNNLAIDSWEWYAIRNVWISAANMPGSLNTEADSWSRVFSEWKLNPIIFKQIVDCFVIPKIDLFASRQTN